MEKQNKKTFLIVSILIGLTFVISLIAFDYLQLPDEKNDPAIENLPTYSATSTIPDQGAYIEVDDRLEQIRGEYSETREVVKPTISPNPHTIQESGWIPPWTFNEGLATVKNANSDLSIVSPVWYEISDDGSLKSRKTGNTDELMKYAKTNNIKVIPMIGEFDFQQFHERVGNPDGYDRHLNSILSEVDKYGYDGIDLDYESIQTEEKDEYRKLIRDLSRELHSRNKLLSVTVLSKWGDGNIYTSLRETRDAQDWSYIGEHADLVRIMAYDYTTTSSPTPGAIGPFDWQIQVLNYAVKKIPREKIWLGVHLYAYEWTNEGQSRALTNRTLESILASGTVISNDYNSIIKENIITYECSEDKTCTTYAMSKRGIEDRRELAKNYEIAGLVYWSIGKEGSLLNK